MSIVDLIGLSVIASGMLFVVTLALKYGGAETESEGIKTSINTNGGTEIENK